MGTDIEFLILVILDLDQDPKKFQTGFSDAVTTAVAYRLCGW